MATLIRRLSQRVDFYSESKAPLNTDGARPQSGLYEKEFSEIRELVDPKVLSTLSDVGSFLNAIEHANGVGIDDRKMLLEHLIVVMSKTKDLEISTKMQQALINLLYKDLPHPPSGYLCLPPITKHSVKPEHLKRKYAYRSADGYNTNPLIPTMGQAGSPYARSVPSTNLSPQKALPDAGLVFDTLLKRDKFVEHPGGISALFFAFADLVIHSIFNTNNADWTINNASSYLDLSVLYGSTEHQVKSVRRMDGSGKLLDDVFADPRLLMMPPASCALLILLNRNHNFIAQRILDINENDHFSDPFPTDPTKKQEQDDEIFHRARLVNCGYFMQIILGDYVGAILGLVRDETDWRLDPLSTFRSLGHDFVPTGEGNVVSIEFNLLYRWHATLSQPDTEFTTDLFNGVFDNADPKDITVQKFKAAAHQHLIPPSNVQEWTFNGLKRDASHRFKDEDLANILHNATEARAGAFKARGVPEALRIIEIMGIQQSRSWGACSLNEFRKFLGLKPYSTFSEWNPDPEIHTAAAALYKDIDSLELHVGLQAEQTKKPGPGAGLCPGYTISRAILADAVSLTRGDRFMTVDFTPFNLTAWGYQDCQYDPKDGSYGGLLTKLLFRTLPEYYPTGSAYAHFPFLVPDFMKKNLEETNPSIIQKYFWTRPRPLSNTVPVGTFKEVQRVLTDTSTYLSAYNERLFTAVKPILANKMARGTLRSEEKTRDAFDAASKKLLAGVAELSKYIFAQPDANVSTYFSKKTRALIQEKAFSNGDIKYVDIVKDVINLLPVHWVSEEIAGFPLKTESNPRGVLYEQPIYEQFAEIAQYVYLNFDPANDWTLREDSQQHCRELVEWVRNHLGFWRMSLSDSQNHIAMENNHAHVFLKKLWNTFGKNKNNSQEFAAQIIAAVLPTAALYSQAVATVVNFYIGDQQKAARESIVNLVTSQDKDASDKIMNYVYEALRLDPPVAGVYRTAAKDDVLGSVKVKAGENIFAGIAEANRDISVFGADPSAVNYSRPLNDYGITALGVDGFLTSEFFKATVPHVLGAIFSLRDIQKGPGQSGAFTRFTEEWHNTQRNLYISQKGLVTPYPDSLIVQFAK